MKKIFLFILLFICVSAKSYGYKLSDDSYKLHTLTFDNLSTNNILDFFSNINVINIYPYVNPIYKNSIGNIFYRVRGYSLPDEINTFKESYLNMIKKNSYLDYNYLYTNGINISKMDVYISDKDLYDIVNSGLLVQVVK